MREEVRGVFERVVRGTHFPLPHEGEGRVRGVSASHSLIRANTRQLRPAAKNP